MSKRYAGPLFSIKAKRLIGRNKGHAEKKSPWFERKVISSRGQVLCRFLQISPRGRAKEDIAAGFYDLEGQIPCQPDGGLKCFGHPIGASGLRMLYEVYKQLQGKAGQRQIKNPRLGLTHNLGGFPSMNVCSICILGNEA